MYNIHNYRARSDDTRTVGPDEPGLVLPEESVLDLDHVHLGDPLSDADDERDLVFHGLKDGGGGERRRDVDGGGVGLDVVTGLSSRVGGGWGGGGHKPLIWKTQTQLFY